MSAADTVQDGSRQWGRVAQVLIGKGGTGLLVENLRITFEVTKTVDATPNAAVIKIYNLHPDNEAKIKTEFDEVLLSAGYHGAVRMVFRGNIKHVYRYREKNEIITEIDAGDGDRDFLGAVINETLAAGTTVNQLVDRAVGTFTGGTKKGVTQVDDRQRLRGKVVSGNTRTVLGNIARESGAAWSIQDGQLQIVKTNGLLPGTAFVLTSETGMLGAPEVNDKGIAVKCLLNPQIGANTAIKLDNNGIKAKRQKALALAKKIEKEKDPVRLDPDGIYKVLKVTHKGDTRGADWTSEIECIGLDQPIPATRK
jgi:hypothetical protein